LSLTTADIGWISPVALALIALKKLNDFILIECNN